MLDFATNAILSNVSNTLSDSVGANIIFRESPTFNFSQEVKKAITDKNIYQNIAGNKQALLLAIYNNSSPRLTDKGIRQRVIKNHRFDITDDKYNGMEKRFVTLDWNIQTRVSCSIKDIIEAVMLNYLYYVKPIAETKIEIEMENVEKPIILNYTTEFSEVQGIDYADYPNYGAMYIMSFDINVTGNIFLPQHTLYPKIKRVINTYSIGYKGGDTVQFHKEVRTIR